MILLRDETSAAAVLDLQETLVAVRHPVGAANRIIIRRTDLLAAAEKKSLDASLHRHHVNMFTGIGNQGQFFLAVLRIERNIKLLLKRRNIA